MIVNVVVRNIDKGVPRHQLYCPIATKEENLRKGNKFDETIFNI